MASSLLPGMGLAMLGAGTGANQIHAWLDFTSGYFHKHSSALNIGLIAGGTDLLVKMKDRVLPGYPEALINLKTIPGLDTIQEENGVLKIGALAILEDIANDATVQANYGALAEAARRTASPHLREMGTIGGNICQDIRCWYYRHPNNRFPCLRKGGGRQQQDGKKCQ